MTTDGWTLVAGHQPVMGTHLDLQLTAADEASARAAEAALIAEAVRLERSFTLFDPTSDICAWRSGAAAEPVAEVADLLGLAAGWQRRSEGAFNPLAGVLTERWRRAAAEGVVPEEQELAGLAASIAVPRFEVVEGAVVRRGDCGAVDLNAIAKGHVVDLVAGRVLAEHDVTRLVLNAGGDLVHCGAGSLTVAVEDPNRPYDNAPPLGLVEIADAAVATSGRSRRWFEIGGVRYSRVLDPRTGRPVAHTAAATVVAPDAATADVLATVTSVLDPAESLALLARLRTDGLDVAALIVDAAGVHHRSPAWTALER